MKEGLMMIDIVSFILPEEKESVHSFAESVQYIEKSAHQGISRLIAAPFVEKDDLINIYDKLTVKIDRINRQLTDYNIDSKVVPGLKVKVFPELMEEKYINGIINLAHCFNYLLLELPNDAYPEYIHDVCYQLQIKGITPILNTVELKTYFQRDPIQLYRLVKNGSATQIQAASIVGQHGKKARSFAQQMIESNQAHLIHSDATRETGILNQALEVIEKRYGKEYKKYFQNNADSMANGNEMERYQPNRIKGKSKLKFW